MEYKVIIIDDNKSIQNDTAFWELEDNFGKSNVLFFNNGTQALSYIEESLDKNLIILLDINFPDREMDGHQLLIEIKKISKLIPVILWSGVDEAHELFSDFINNGAFGFVSKTSTTEELFILVNKAVSFLKTSLDNTLEDWLVRKPGDKDKPVFFTANGKSFSLNEILHEIRMQTEVGRSFSEKLNKLTIDLLLRSKESLNG